MQTKVQRQGNSFIVRIPAVMAQQLNIEAGDMVNVNNFGDVLTISIDNSNEHIKKEVLETISASVNFLIYEKDAGNLTKEIETVLLEVIKIGSSILLEDDTEDNMDTLSKQLLLNIQKGISLITV